MAFLVVKYLAWSDSLNIFYKEQFLVPNNNLYDNIMRNMAQIEKFHILSGNRVH